MIHSNGVRRRVPIFGKVLSCLALGSFAIGVCRFASAQTDEQRADARALAVQGLQAFSSGRWQDAIDLFERAESLVHAPTHLLFAARAHAKLHHYVKARELYLRIVHQNLDANASHAFRDAQASASQEIAEVEPHIAELTVSVRGADPKDVRVVMDGAAVQSVLIGVARPIDPGEHQVRAEAPGFAAQTKKVVVADGATASVVLELVPGANSSSKSSDPQSGARESTAPAAASAPVGAPRDAGGAGSNGKRVGAYVAFGAGAVGVGAGVFFGLRSISERSQADQKFQQCGGVDGCRKGDPLSADVASLDRSASSAKTSSVVGFALGGAAVAAGVTLLVLSSNPKKVSTGLALTPWIGAGSAGVTGKF